MRPRTTIQLKSRCLRDIHASLPDIDFVNEIEHLLDDALETSAAAHGFHFIPTWEQTAAHTLCEPEPWIWGLTAYLNFSASCDPGYIKGDADGWICVKLGALHPNEGGVAALHEIVAAEIPTAFYTRIVSGDIEPGGTIALEGGGFYPGERVDLVLHSTPVALGSVTANARGGFATTVALPSSVPLGAHTITATGQMSGHAFSTSVAFAMPASGFELALPALVGLGLVAIGGGFLLARRRSA